MPGRARHFCPHSFYHLSLQGTIGAARTHKRTMSCVCAQVVDELCVRMDHSRLAQMVYVILERTAGG